MQITEMMKELREKGTGEEELAAAHAKWLEEQDSYTVSYTHLTLPTILLV